MKKRLISLFIFALVLSGCTPNNGTNITDETSTPTPEGTSESLSIDNYLDQIDPSVIGELNPDWDTTYRVMAHALGGIDDYDYTNSLEAFVYNYNQGTKLFETDLEHTSEGTLILAHTWQDFHLMLDETDVDNYEPMSDEEFKDAKIYGKYTTMTFDDLLKVMEDLPDFYVIIDSKTFDTDSTNDIYQEMIEHINAVNPDLIKRFVPQAYSPEIYDVIAEYDFDKIIFTLYSYYNDSDGQKIYQLAKERNVPVIVMHMDNDWASKVIRDVYAYHLLDSSNYRFNIYIHTVNDMDKALDIINNDHFFGVYSDFITEKSLDEKLQSN